MPLVKQTIPCHLLSRITFLTVGKKAKAKSKSKSKEKNKARAEFECFFLSFDFSFAVPPKERDMMRPGANLTPPRWEIYGKSLIPRWLMTIGIAVLDIVEFKEVVDPERILPMVLEQYPL